MLDLDDLLAIDDEPRGAIQTGGLCVAEPCANSAELQAIEAMYVDPAYKLASEIIFEDVDDPAVAERSLRQIGDLIGSAGTPDMAAVAAWQSELWAECWRRYGVAIHAARNRG
jgi:hypothetical protein